MAYTQLLIGISAGLVSMALFASSAATGGFAGIAHFLSPLPLCLAGLGWGRTTALIGSLSGTLLMILFLGPVVSLVYALTLAIPIAILVHLALLSRPLPTGDHGSTTMTSWYAPGQLVGWTAVMAGCLAGLQVLRLGPSEASYLETIGEMIPPLVALLDPDGTTFTPETVEKLKLAFARMLPAGLAIGWAAIPLLNLWIAGRIVQSSGHALRPWPDLHSLELPNFFVVALATALALTFLPGVLGLIATGFAGAILFAFTLQGLAVLHVYSQRFPLRPLFLAVVYLGFLFTSGIVPILVAIVGLAEPLLGLRSGQTPPSPPASPGDGASKDDTSS